MTKKVVSYIVLLILNALPVLPCLALLFPDSHKGRRRLSCPNVLQALPCPVLLCSAHPIPYHAHPCALSEVHPLNLLAEYKCVVASGRLHDAIYSKRVLLSSCPLAHISSSSA